MSQYYARYLKETHPELFSGLQAGTTMWLSSDPLSKELRFSLCVNDPHNAPWIPVFDCIMGRPVHPRPEERVSAAPTRN